ncbi:MAG TPA: serine hydrolase [Longimicrobiales bacterium]|nr:serine hydrolase [Longimicrobiales bacterium]
MTITRSAPLAILALLLAAPVAGQQAYFPDRHGWERRDPATAGMSAARLREAVAFARSSESPGPRDLLEAHWRGFAREPHGQPVGPFTVRGPQTGVILRGGYIVAEWGEPERVDMTFSVSKSFLSTAVGLALSEGLIARVDDRVAPYLPPVLLPAGDGEPGSEAGPAAGGGHPVGLFASAHNRRITWDHLLRQTSDWEGTLWGKPDWSDRPDRDPDTWRTRERPAPGTVYEYNDTRVNLLALAATLVWRQPLPVVLRERVMRPIGASDTWQWHGYESSWVLLDGLNVQAVSGGGHWGGGMFINAYDQARFGLLTLRRFRWRDRQILPESWWRMATTPTGPQPGYGFMNFFLNTGRERFPAAPESAWVHLGAGTNMIYCDPENDLVIVSRWIRGDAVADLVEKVLGAIERSP